MKSESSAQNPDCFEAVDGLLSVQEARQRILDFVKPVTGRERVAIRAALNRVLAEDIISPINVPPHANSAMDGYAVIGSDLSSEGDTVLKLVGTSFAGIPYKGNVKNGECVRIMTGAKMPGGTDTVIMQEHVSTNGDDITIGTGHNIGQNVRHPGEDIAIGRTVLHAGKHIGAAELGLLASLGIAEVTIKRKLRVAFFSTGDELRAVGEQLEEGQIYDSNRYTLYGMLNQASIELIDMGVIRDDQQAIEQAFIDASSIADVIITSGGVSVGEADYVKMTLEKVGQVDFWKIAMKPGKPLAFGKINNAIFLGLPGNPVSVMATFYLFALPALRLLMGKDIEPALHYTVRAKNAIKKRPGRADFQRGILSEENGELLVDNAGMQASHILSGMSRANCFIALPAESAGVNAGDQVEVIPFTGLFDS